MATREQIETIEIIKREKTLAKEKHLKVLDELSGGLSKYKTAISTIMSVGSLAVVVSVISLVMTTIDVVRYTQEGVVWDTQSILYVAFEYGVLATTAVLGWKLSLLDATPLFILVSLIIILITNALLFAGILPWITVILAIIGLVCWGTYKNWFNDIDASSYNKKKKTRE